MNSHATQCAGGSLFRLLPAFFLLTACGMAGAAVDFTLERIAPETYTAGATLDVTVSLDLVTTEMLTAIGLEETLPAGWQYMSVVGGATPQITPSAGKEGLLEFAWFPLPGPFPLSFTYRVSVPAEATGDVQITGSGVGRTLESGVIVTPTAISSIEEPGFPIPNVIGLTQAAATTALTNEGFVVGDISQEYSVTIAVDLVKRTNPITGSNAPAGATVDLVLSLGQGAVHTGDTVPDGVISLNELLRVIQFFNSGGYSCADGEMTEDGYVPGTLNPRTCAFHDSDTDEDWGIALAELLRFIQFFNSGGYHPCPDEMPPTEDGFCPMP